MLVYLKLPMGYTQIGPYRIYGKKYCSGKFGSTDIPKKLYVKNKDILEEAEYTSEWLESKFNRTFPTISFRPSELYNIRSNTLVKIAKLVGIDYIKKGKLTVSEKKALCRSILSIIT